MSKKLCEWRAWSECCEHYKKYAWQNVSIKIKGPFQQIKSGIEGSIYVFRSLYEDLSIEGYCVLVMDASNAFNSVSCAVAIWNTRIYCSHWSRSVFNSYRGYAVLFIAGFQVTLLSKEGVTQVDSLAILVYGIGIVSLKTKPNDSEKWNQNWYIDDSVYLAKLLFLKECLLYWWRKEQTLGYYPESDMSHLVVHADQIECAHFFF